MTASIAQHPILWMLAAFLAGALAEWILEMFFFRQRLFEAEDRARRRSEELDSERFHHSRTQADLRVRMGELDAAAKGRTLAESLLQAARAKLATAEAEAAAARESGQAAGALAVRLEQERDAALRETAAERSGRLDLALQIESQRAEADTQVSVVADLRNHLAQALADGEAAGSRISRLEADRQSLAARVDQQAASLEAARKEQARVAEQLAQAREELAGARSREGAAAARLASLEKGSASLSEELRKSEAQVEAASKASAAADQRLKARSEEIRQISHQLGEASEELAAVRSRLAQTNAQLEAASATRTSLERDLAARERELAEARAAAGKPTTPAKPDARTLAEIAELREALIEAQRSAASMQNKAEELEAELLTTTRAHQEAVRELEKQETLRPESSAGTEDDALASELEAMTRERNELAAELAALRAANRK